MKKQAHELSDSLAAVATMTSDGKALADRAIEIALQDAYDLGWTARGAADTKKVRLLPLMRWGWREQVLKVIGRLDKP